MPAFTTIAFDRLIEPGASNSMVPPRNFTDSKLERRHSTPNTNQVREIVTPSSKLERGATIPYNSTFDKRRNSESTTTTTVIDKKHHRTQISPALYATPESTPLPDYPSSFPPSPYIINHKRRGPRLIKSFSEDDVATWKHEIKVDENGNTDENDVAATSISKDGSFVPMKVLDLNGAHNNENGGSDMKCGPSGQNGVMKPLGSNLHKDVDVDVDDFVYPQDSMSVNSNGESEGNGGTVRSLNLTTPLAEFYDAWEELSSENGLQLQTPDIEAEVREIRLSLLMEIEKRKQAEEALCNLRNQWHRIREEFSLVGLTLPVDPTSLPGGEQPDDDHAADNVCQQVYLARFVSHSIGRGIAKAEIEMDMEARIKTKNFEIARLWDRLHYYEAVNQEMSQRNQEVVETARRLRQRRKRRQRWVWGSIATAITLGSAILAYSYFHSGQTSSSHSPLLDPAIDRDTN
ncbi:hypothetical protein OROGR_018952 [Orobanche gracilis]